MQNIEVIFKEIFSEVEPIMEQMDQVQMEAAVRAICSAKRIFAVGMGRSGYMMRCFGMRLMQMGLTTFMIGDTSTPSAQEGDLLVIGSGSGETASLKGYVKRAKQLKCKVLVLTGHPESTLGREADVTIVLPVQEELHKNADGSMIVYDTKKHGTKMLLGSRIELCMLLCTEALCMMVFQEMGFDESDMMRRHACFE